MSDAISTTNTKHDDEFWLDDGNIVIVAQQASFRVHKSVLSRHSNFFKDLFTVPQPSGPLDCSFENLPVVAVSDTCYDFKALLDMMYGDRSYQTFQSLGVPLLAALARMSHKYRIDQLLSAVLEALSLIYTHDFDIWTLNIGLERTPLSDSILSRAVEAANLFRKLDRKSMLVSALYACCQLPGATVVRGTERVDGTLERLSEEDIVLCFDMQKKLMALDLKIANQIKLMTASFTPAKGCSSGSRCIADLTVIEMWPIGTNPLRHRLYGAMAKQSHWLSCQHCKAVIRNRLNDLLRSEVWRKLPELMGIHVDDWDTK